MRIINYVSGSQTVVHNPHLIFFFIFYAGNCSVFVCVCVELYLINVIKIELVNQILHTLFLVILADSMLCVHKIFFIDIKFA